MPAYSIGKARKSGTISHNIAAFIIKTESPGVGSYQYARIHIKNKPLEELIKSKEFAIKFHAQNPKILRTAIADNHRNRTSHLQPIKTESTTALI
jgi:hypothetical protein